MEALVTGGAGFIGSNLVDELLSLGWKVAVVDNESSEANERFIWNQKCENYRYDITDYRGLNSVFERHKFDYVFHLAAESRIQSAIDNPLRCTAVNVTGTCNVLQCSRKHNVKRVMYSSTSSAYGLTDISPQTEDLDVDCLNPYSVTKVAGESLCKMYYDLFGVETIIFRYFNVYGHRQPTKGVYAPVVGLFIKQFKAGKSMTITGDGEQRRDYISVNDIVQANIKAALIDNKEAPGNIFNIGTGINYSVVELAKLIGGGYTFIPTRQGEAKITLADITKAKEMLQWSPTDKLETYIKEQLNDNS
jgi:UDP-glucose 4-epimerase